MSTDIELRELDNELENYIGELNGANEKEAVINAQIAALRLELAELRDKRFQVNQSIRKARVERESLVRKKELEEEAALIEKEINEKRAAAEEILANAPWRDIAFDWQIDGAIKLPSRALLGDKRGMGKTLSALMWRRFQGAKKLLICLRKEVATDFIKEIGIREPGLFVYPMLGATADERKMAAMLLSHHEEFVVVTNIESWRRSVEATTDDILKIKYDAVILDEAHHIKNAHTGTAQGFMRIAQRIPRVLEMTGTPIKNKPQEMFTLLHALYPDLFREEKYFLSDFCQQIAQNKWTFTPNGLKNLVHKISAFYIARSPEDVGRKVPPPRMIEYELDFDSHPQQQEVYKYMTERSLAFLGEDKVIPVISQLAVMTRQAQIVSWPADIEFKIRDPETNDVVDIVRFDVHQSVKMDWAEDLINELVEEGERLILFSRFKPAIYELRRRLVTYNIPVAVITGDEKAKGNTKEILDDFDLKTAPENPKFKVLLATYQTVGESANLNAARHMILYDRFWNPGNEDQAIGRIDRINSIDQATVHIPLVKSSIDTYMTDLIEGKRNIVTEFKDATSMKASLIDHLRSTL